MLATIGFTVAGIIIFSFATTFDKNIVTGLRLNLRAFSASYYCLAAAFLLWGAASAVNDPQFLIVSVIAGDILIATATILQLSLLVPKNYFYELVTFGTLISAVLVAARIVYTAPEPYIRDSLLYFNLTNAVAVVIGVAFCAIWLPASVRVARSIMQAAGHPEMSQIYIGQYFGATACALLFLSAHRFVTIVASFVALSVLFALLTYSNTLIQKITVKERHAAK